MLVGGDEAALQSVRSAACSAPGRHRSTVIVDRPLLRTTAVDSEAVVRAPGDDEEEEGEDEEEAASLDDDEEEGDDGDATFVMPQLSSLSTASPANPWNASASELHCARLGPCRCACGDAAGWQLRQKTCMARAHR